MKRRFLTGLLALLLVLLPIGARAEAPDMSLYAPDGQLSDTAVEAESAVLMDFETGTVLYGKNADAQMFPASITKIVTCIVVLDYMQKNNVSEGTTVTVGELPKLEQGATSIALQKDEQIRLIDLLYGLMLPSGNDAAIALAEFVGGSVEGFAKLMNDKAEELGMTNSHFVNSNGLADPQHYTTARDMAKVCQAAMSNEEFRKIVSTVQYTCPATNKTAQPREWKNSNRLIREDEKCYLPDAVGIKTGYTMAAGNTLACAAKKGDKEVIAVVLKAETTEQRFNTGARLLEYGLNFFDTMDVSALLTQRPITCPIAVSPDGSTAPVEIPVNSVALSDQPVLLMEKTARINDLTADPTLFEQKLQWNTNLTAPVAMGQELGTAVYYLDGKEVFSCKLTAAQAVNAPATPEPLLPSIEGMSTGTRWLLIILGVVAMLLLLMLLVASANARRRRRRRARMSARAVGGSYSRSNTRRRRH